VTYGPVLKATELDGSCTKSCNVSEGGKNN